MTPTYTEEKSIVDLYTKQTDFLFSDNFRKKALADFDTAKIPDNKTKNWRKFDADTVFKHKYKLIELKKIQETLFEEFALAKENNNRLVIINGKLEESLSKRNTDEIIIDSLKNADEHLSEYEDFLNEKERKKNTDYFSQLNDCYVKDGAFIHIPDNVSIKEPIHILHFLESEHENIFSQNRNLIIAGKNTSFKVIHTFHSLCENFSLNNTVTDIKLAENANVEYYLFEGEGNNAAHINSINIRSEKNSFFKSNAVTFCGSAVRNNFFAYFADEHAEVDIQGVYMPDKEQHISNFVEIVHAKPHCKSNQLFKGIIDNRAVSVFTGKVYVAKDAQKSDSVQSNKNLLLTDYAKAHSRPQLEIYADDVSCSHGSTTGQLDKEALFYMRTRGISEGIAKTMLMKAFLQDVTDNISEDTYREYVNFLITKRLKGQSPEGLCAVLLCPNCP